MFQYSVIFLTYVCICYGIYYDSYRGTEISIEDVKRYNKTNATIWCTNDIQPCDPHEGRRVDGSCNNLKNPSAGAGNTRPVRLLPAVYDQDFKPKKTKSGNEMPLARFLRTSLLFEGRIPDQVFTQLTTHFLPFALADVLSVHDTAAPGANTILGVNLFTIWTWRYHNKVASELAAMNPCWSDDRLFDTARDINIAVMMQIFFYEMLSVFMGYENLVRDSVLSPSPGHRDLYNPNVLPQLSLESLFMWRYMHIIQDGSLKMYDDKGHYLKQVPVVNMTLRTGFLSVDNNLDYITQGSFRQASGKVNDNIVDPDIAGLGLGPFQRANDIPSSDLTKNRLFGLQPYIKYKEYCTGKTYESFDSLLEFIDVERVEMLKDLYEDLEDIDLIAGVWMERLIDGGKVPPTFYCIVVEQLVRTIVSDRHWFERPNRPGAFDAAQLGQIRKASVARLLCDVADSVSEIQPHAFLRQGLGNKMMKCNDIPDINLRPWKDHSCYKAHVMWMKYQSY